MVFFYPIFSSNFAAQFKIIARSSHFHRVTIAHTYTCSQQAHMVFPADASRVLKITRLFKILKILFEYNEKFCLILRNRPKAVVLYKNPNKSILFFSFYSSLRGLFLTLSSPHLAVIYQADMEGIDYGYCSW